MKEVKITIPDNCELVKDGDSYVVREKMQNPPRSWEEFCERYPIKRGEACVTTHSGVYMYEDRDTSRLLDHDKTYCVSKREAEVFLALMQLRQLRKAWVGDWKQPSSNTYIAAIAYNINNKEIVVKTGNYWANMILSFPTLEMAEDFLNCFKDLCETAKILL